MANKRRQKAVQKAAKKAKLDQDVESDVEEVVAAGVQLEDVAPLSLPGKWINKQKVLVFCSRGVSFKARHFVKDLLRLLPHSKTDVKLDKNSKMSEINEICEMKRCNKCIYLEGRKNRDLYMWISNVPHGVSAVFNVENLNSMEELKFFGNCLKSSRAILNFDSAFDTEPHMVVLKELFTQTFGTPRYYPKSQPFIDNVIQFSYLDGRIWFRNYQIAEEGTDMVEIGPRFCLKLSRVFAGSFGGKVLYINDKYQSPNLIRHIEKANDKAKSKKGNKYLNKVHQKNVRNAKDVSKSFPRDSTKAVFD